VSPDERAEAAAHPSGSTPRAAESQLPRPKYTHLRRLTNETGLWEHARILTPRVEHGFCTDDNARGLLVVSRSTSPPSELADLAAIYLSFVLDARTGTGQFHNRRDADGGWIDDVGSDDSQGRAWWGLGTVARLGPVPWMREAAFDAFASSNSFESPHLRANAYAALGAAEILNADPGNAVAAELLERTSGMIAAAAGDRIPWPEARLTYDNARLPEALLAAGSARGDRHLISVGIRLLEWLVRAETNHDHFSFTPVDGWAPGGPRPAFDQQPIDAAAMAEACYRAWTITHKPVWRERALDAARWFMGHNDTGMVLYASETGGTCDGLMQHSVNENRGAESTLAGIAALQIAALCSAGGLGTAAY
jgi:hypothetical protein